MEAGGLGILRTGRPRYPTLFPSPPLSFPSNDHLEGLDYSGEEKAPERRLRVATDITVTHTRSRSRILSGISCEPNRRRSLPRRRRRLKRERGEGRGALRDGDSEGARRVRERDGEISFLGY